MSSAYLRQAIFVAATAMTLAVPTWAQSVTGSIYGAAEPGATVTIENLGTGTKRSTSVDRNGRYRAADLPAGNYKVSVTKDGVIVGARDRVEVLISSGTDVSFAQPDAGVQDLARVNVTAAAVPRIDVSQVDTRTVFTAEDMLKIAVSYDISSVALLAPSVVANSSYGVPSFGGSASSENAYYINGYPVTNPLSSIGFTTLPFDAIAQQQVLTGGYGAEFGRATGGVINVVTKRGSNEWKGGAYSTWSPESLRASPRNVYFANTGFYGSDNPDPTKRTDGALYQYRKKNQSWTQRMGAYAGGPLIKDKLFFYANVELTKREGSSVASTSQTARGSSNAWRNYSSKDPRWAAKIDWNISDNHLLEFTGISDVNKYESEGFTFDYRNMARGEVQNAGTSNEDKSKLYIGKYTGHLTDRLSVSALYGTQKIEHSRSPWGYDPSCPRTSSTPTDRAPGIPESNYSGCWTAASFDVPGAYDKTKGYRFDVSYRIGNHDLRAGLDNMEAESFTGSEYGGGFAWVYSRSDKPNTAIDAGLGVGSPASGGGLGRNGYYVRKQYNTQMANVRTEQTAQYIEDRWQVTDTIVLQLGLRNETFKNYTSANEVYVKQDNQWAPRLGFVWDVRGDSSLKLFANAGRYHLALPNNVAVRAASNSLITREYFTYTGVSANGTPTGLVPIPVDPSMGYTCPGTNAVSSNLECGKAPNARTVAADNLKSHYQDEYIVGLESALGSRATWGAKITYRDLKSAIDDTCSPVLGGGCFIFNPGEGNTFYRKQPDGSFKYVHYTAEQLALPKLKRRYYALDLFLEGSIGEKFTGRVNYTFSRNYGNTEGQLASDLDTGGGGQTDVSATQDWDLPQLMRGANGPLPNHRAHQLKAYGSYQINEEWRVGGSLLVDSGRPRSCTSFYPTADKGLYNGSYYYYCGLAGSGTKPGTPGYVPPSKDYRPSPRGSNGEAPWNITLNLSVAYLPSWADKKLTLQADVFNVFNRQVPAFYYSGYSSNRVTPNPRYNQPMDYSSPRQVRFSARYDF
ncbi:MULTISPECIES: TonB-dependent receptor [Stenotrophomonas]|uniref:TonB-dependent receptor n=1 Tax=Stenotrophomonas maltophilia TaxID=40324 RepID=A0A431UJK7_STEMA|nr:TonB-dependent receptor [Stenotrophomonas maltophilia]RTQ89977.1 TonB-dependent receptor [Stenotrophomonas maltophilia]